MIANRSSPPASQWPRLVPLLAFLYVPFVGGGLLTDDFSHVVRLSSIESPTRLLDTPDAFGFYRPVTQASLAVAPGLRGTRPAQARALNIALHALAIGMAFVVAHLLLQSDFAAGLAVLAFALTPKAPAIAVLWISARGELLMALFSLASIAAWIVWTRHGRGWWLAAAIGAYGLALLSKETATLLPLLLLLTPGPERPFAVRAGAVTGFVVLAMFVYTWRAQTGALTPFTGDEHYAPAISAALWLRNATNYAGRVVAAPLALIVLLGLAGIAGRRHRQTAHLRAYLIQVDLLVFAAAFIVVFLAPVLPISLRSELYLYLPVFGVCLFAGWLGSLLFRDIEPRPLAVAVAVYTLALGAYHVARASEIQHDLRFSEGLVNALRSHRPLAATNDSLLLIPSDRAMEQSLKRTVGGYFHVVLQYALPGPPRGGAVLYSGDPPRQWEHRLVGTYDQSSRAFTFAPAP